MEPSPDSTPGNHVARAAVEAAGAARRMAGPALADGPRAADGALEGGTATYAQGRARELGSLAGILEEVAEEARTLDDRLAIAPDEDRARLLQRVFDLAFEVLEGAAAVVRLGGVAASAAGQATSEVTGGLPSGLVPASLEAQAALELTLSTLRSLAGRMEASDELRLRLRVGESILAEIQQRLSRMRSLDPHRTAANGGSDD
ncbi:hypothetical protein [Engelhardtia mirabilis]|uniref:Uncharacterized protein n=1 Tax=Engelhardtia mirabilis TaxID=2528011 RepID=A0A518BQN1_9BACT|nr:hypothetical protein Pla133_44030 [Planctomycetes bacterium Pla133]QDV03610.1 hypothetical protein Pla86_44010 [Planctomycetes bacterium Pla86]